MVDVNDTQMNDTPETGGVDTIPTWAHHFYRAIESKMNVQLAEIRASVRSPPAPAAPAAPSAPDFIPTIPSELRRKTFPKLPTYHGIKTEFRPWFTQTQTKLNVDLKHFSEPERFWYIHNRLKEKVLGQMESWVQTMLQIGTFLVKNLIAQLRLAYDNPESLEIAIKKLNDMKQRSKPFSVFISGLKKNDVGSWRL